MPKVTLDKEAFKALASETRLDILKTLDAMNKAIRKGLDDIEIQKINIYERVSPLIEKNVNLANSLEDDDLAKIFQELNRNCIKAARKADEMNNLNKEILRLLKEI